jgi:hypothetical protein
MDKSVKDLHFSRILSKVIGLLAAIVITFLAFQGHQIYLGIGFSFLGLMMIYDGYIIIFRKRNSCFKDDLPFYIIFLICLAVKFIILLRGLLTS